MQFSTLSKLGDSTRKLFFKRSTAPILILFFGILVIRITLIDRPFLANDEGTATAIPVIHAVNIARYGPLSSKFAGVLNTGFVEAANWAPIYAHHPPLVPLLIAGAYALFGISEWSTRMIPACFSIGTTILLYSIGFHRCGRRVGVLACIFYALCPLTITFGAMPDYVNAQVVFFMLATMESYLRWVETNRRVWLIGAIIAFTLGALSDWPIFYLVPILACHYGLTHDRSVARTLRIALPGLAVLVALFLWANWASGDTLSLPHESIFQQIRHRTFQLTDDQQGSITFGRWLKTVLFYNIAWLHTWPVFLLSVSYVCGVIVLITRGRWEILRRQDSPILLLAAAMLHLAIGMQGNFQHSWWAVIATPALALSAAVAIEFLVANLPNQLWIRTVIPAAIMVVFLSWSISTAYDKLNEQPWLDPHAASDGYYPAYTAKNLGAVIQAISRNDEGVITTVSKQDPALWFYSDRQLRPNIQRVAQLRDALQAGPYPLPYWYPQPNGPRPRWFVVPPSHRSVFHDLTNRLDLQFPRRDINGYAIYKLY